MRAYSRGKAGEGFTFAGKPCGLCGDPDRSPGEWHSEDYSQPYSFTPPASYPICASCHGRLHKRFNQPAEEWELFCRHVEAGGYGREFTKLYPTRTRAGVMAAIAAGSNPPIAQIREIAVASRWWRDLTLDPDSLHAPWARPRPLRPRPDATAFKQAAASVDLSDRERLVLRVHASEPRRSATMRLLALTVFQRDAPGEMNLFYGRLARRLCEHLGWSPDRRDDGSPIWMSVVAEGWYPPKNDSPKREHEWVMVHSLAVNWMGRSA